MNGVWFAQVKGEELGPLADDELRALAANHRLTPDDMIRKGFSGNWVPAARVRGLFGSEGVRSAANEAPPESDATSEKAAPGTPQPPPSEATFTKKKLAFALGIAAVLCGSTGSAYYLLATPTPDPATVALQQQADEFMREARRLKNLIEMGASDRQCIEQANTLRHLLAGFDPTSETDKATHVVLSLVYDQLAAYLRCRKSALDRAARVEESQRRVDRYGDDDHGFLKRTLAEDQQKLERAVTAFREQREVVTALLEK